MTKKPIPSAPEKQEKSRKKPVVLFLTAGIAAAAVLVLLGWFLISRISAANDPFDNRILNNISVAGVDLGGMTKGQATKAVRSATADTYSKQDMVLQLPDDTITFSPKDTGAALDVKAAVNAAFNYGRTGSAADQQAAFDSVTSGKHEIDLKPYLSLNEEYIQSVLNEYAAGFSGKYIPSGFQLENDLPILTEDQFDSSVQCPSLLLNTGAPGFGLDMNEIFNRVLDAYQHNQFDVTISDMTTQGTPETIDLQAVLDQVTVAPVEPILDKATGEITPGSYGCTFDLEAAQTLLSAAGFGETVRIPMEFVAPRYAGEEVYFQDVVGFCQTPHGNNEKRNANLKLATASLNGVVIRPGETLSYNETLGQRTKENGYMPAPAYSGTTLVDSIGGGICQVSSTLYLCSLYAELETVDRVSHGYPVNYIPLGLDATVNWGTPDLKIKNNSKYPVKIVAEEADGFVRVWLMGTETRNYYVRMEFTGGGNYAKSYKCKYDNVTNEQLSRDFERLSSYYSTNYSAKGEIGSKDAYVGGLVKEQEPCSPSAEALAASVPSRPCNTHAE